MRRGPGEGIKIRLGINDRADFCLCGANVLRMSLGKQHLGPERGPAGSCNKKQPPESI
jgi:hypothetical protein